VYLSGKKGIGLAKAIKLIKQMLNKLIL